MIAYAGGNLRVDVSDGSWQVAGCAFNGSPTGPFFPSMPCPLGTTAAIVTGDIDFDGVPDNGSFWSLPQPPIPAAVIAPFRPDKVSVVSAPFSRFPRPGILPVAVGGATLFYNVLENINQQQYDVAGYVHSQDFPATPAGRRLHDETVVIGAYRFGLPRRLDPDLFPPVVVSLNKLPMPESWPGITQSPIDSGFRFTNRTWNNGSIELDPRIPNDITWNGIDGTNYLSGNDTYRFWIQQTASLNPFDLPAPPFDPNVTFPFSGSPFILTQNEPLDGGYRLPQSFFNIGDTGTMYLRLDRNHFTTGATRDTSVRVWTANIRFVDTYEGFALFGFPVGTEAGPRQASFDFDGDGASNLLEYGLNTDPSDPASNPTTTNAVVPFINGAGQCEVTITKRPNVGSSLIYEVEYSSDMGVNDPWVRITPTDPNWTIVTDNETELTVRSNNIIPAAQCFIRAVITENIR